MSHLLLKTSRYVHSPCWIPRKLCRKRSQVQKVCKGLMFQTLLSECLFLDLWICVDFCLWVFVWVLSDFCFGLSLDVRAFICSCLNVCMCICTPPPPPSPCAVPLRFLYTLAVFCSRLLVLSSMQTFANSSGVYFYLSSLSFFSFQTFFCFVCCFISYWLHHVAIGRGWIYWTVAAIFCMVFRAKLASYSLTISNPV